MEDRDQNFDAWNPGLGSEIPARLLPQVTLYRPENSDVDYKHAKEAADFCGLKPQDMTALKVSRLVVHEVMIRVTADFYVPDGPNYEELGLNLRSMVARIVEGHILLRLNDLERNFAEIRRRVESRLNTILTRDIYERAHPDAPKKSKGLIARLLPRKTAPAAAPELPEILALAEWQSGIAQAGTDLETTCLMGLHTIVGGIVGRRGRLMADKDMVLKLAGNWVCNSYGSRRIGEIINPMILEAARIEGYRLLPHQDEPFIMNVKGASGAGKSTIRPLQRALAERLGIHWEDFALISPDYWRKYLFDYASLGEDFKYAAMLTGQELEIIDKKLDRYMEEKATRQEMPHLLIDRFRFDSFSLATNQQSDGRLLSRFGATVFLFFVITPPTETVERAWKRGKETGRYKAVDDLLYHNIEAYTGMPNLFFSWVNKSRQKIHFEFLDNDVPIGHRPRTAAFGWNGRITILDPDCMARLTRYRNVNIEARNPAAVFNSSTGTDESFLVDCIANVPVVTFADPVTLRKQAAFEQGKLVFSRDGYLASIGLGSYQATPDDMSGSHTGVPDRLETGQGDTIDTDHERPFMVGVFGELPY